MIYTLTSVDGSLPALGIAVRIENEFVQDGRQTSSDDGTEPEDL